MKIAFPVSYEQTPWSEETKPKMERPREFSR